jgi:hypothetical protein
VHRYRAALVATAVILALFAGADLWVAAQRERYEREIERLRASMTTLERQRADAIVSQERGKLRLAVELMRRQAHLEPGLHLSIAVDSGTMTLEREGALLRGMAVQIGPERRIGIAPDTVLLAAPRGVRTVARVLDDSAAWEVPAWVYADRELVQPAARALRGALGPAAIVLDGGTVIYSIPSVGPLNDSAYVLPGSIRARTEDLRAIVPNLTPGMRVYLY